MTCSWNRPRRQYSSIAPHYTVALYNQSCLYKKGASFHCCSSSKEKPRSIFRWRGKLFSMASCMEMFWSHQNLETFWREFCS